MLSLSSFLISLYRFNCFAFIGSYITSVIIGGDRYAVFLQEKKNGIARSYLK